MSRSSSPTSSTSGPYRQVGNGLVNLEGVMPGFPGLDEERHLHVSNDAGLEQVDKAWSAQRKRLLDVDAPTALELIDHARVAERPGTSSSRSRLQAFAAMLSWLPDNYQCTLHWNFSTKFVTADEFREAINAWRNPGEPNGTKTGRRLAAVDQLTDVRRKRRVRRLLNSINQQPDIVGLLLFVKLSQRGPFVPSGRVEDLRFQKRAFHTGRPPAVLKPPACSGRACPDRIDDQVLDWVVRVELCRRRCTSAHFLS